MTWTELQTKNIQVTKFRRRKNFFKKGYELSQICGLEVLIMTYDKKYDILHEFCTSPDFKFDKFTEVWHEKNKM